MQYTTPEALRKRLARKYPTLVVHVTTGVGPITLAEEDAAEGNIASVFVVTFTSHAGTFREALPVDLDETAIVMLLRRYARDLAADTDPEVGRLDVRADEVERAARIIAEYRSAEQTAGRDVLAGNADELAAAALLDAGYRR